MAANDKQEEYSLSEFEEDDEDEGSYEEESFSEEDLETNGIKHLDSEKELNRLDTDDYGVKNAKFNENGQNIIDTDTSYVMQSPEMLLAKLRKDDDNYLEFESLKVNRIKCLGLCKILFGQRDWRTAEAHLQLGETYSKGKYYYQQCLKHANLARDILLDVQNKGSNAVPTLELQNLLQNMYLLLGKTNYKIGKYKVSENCLLKAKLVSDKTQSDNIKFVLLRVSILSALGETFSMLGNFGQSTEYIEEAIEIVHKMPSTYMHLCINLYKQIVNIELMNEKHANLETAYDFANKAVKVSIEVNGRECKETAQLFILSCKVESLKEISNYEKIEKNIDEAMEIYKTLKLPENEIVALKMHCKILMQQEKITDAKTTLDEAILKSESVFGDCSLQTAELYDLMGSILFSQKKLPAALNFFLKASEIYEGKRKCAEKREKLNRIIEIIRKSCKDDTIKTSDEKLKERPRFA